jgi:hypothetical protein
MGTCVGVSICSIGLLYNVMVPQSVTYNNDLIAGYTRVGEGINNRITETKIIGTETEYIETKLAGCNFGA